MLSFDPEIGTALPDVEEVLEMNWLRA